MARNPQEGVDKPAEQLSAPSTRASSTASLEAAAGAERERRSAGAGNVSWSVRLLSAATSSRSTAFKTALGVALLLWWTRTTRGVVRRPTKWGPGRLGLLCSSGLVALARCLGITASNEAGLQVPPHVAAVRDRLPVLACWHPHGLYTMTPLLFHSQGPRHTGALTYGFFTAVAGACFKVPIFREILMLVNCREADKATIDKLLGAGKSVFVCPGGIHEQLQTDPAQERVFFPPNLGFVRQAIAHGTPLVPTYNFGENQLYDVPELGRRLSWWIKRHTGFGVTFGLGRFGLPFLPKTQHISIRVGGQVEVGPAEAKPTEAHVLDVFRRYCIELARLFDEHKATDLPADVAAKGLQMIWRDYEAVDLSLEGLQEQNFPRRLASPDGKCSLFEPAGVKAQPAGQAAASRL